MSKIFSVSEIDEIIIKFKSCIKKGNYYILNGRGRKKNMQFIEEFNLNKIKIERLLLSIDAQEFDSMQIGKNKDFSGEKLWIFILDRELTCFDGNKEVIDIYLKWYFEKEDSVIISFHKAKYSLSESFGKGE